MLLYEKLKKKILNFLDDFFLIMRKILKDIKPLKLGKENWILIFVGLMMGLLVVVFGAFRLRDVEIVGNYYYSRDDIKQMILKGPLGHNTLFLKYEYMGPQRELLPLIEEIDIELENPYKIIIKVYEKDMIGYVQKDGEFLYIDKDGILVEKTMVPIQNMMSMEGVEVNDALLYKKVKTTQPNQIQYARQINEMLKNHKIKPDKLIFDVQKMTLMYQDTRIELGNSDYLQEKLTVLVSIFDKIEGQAGTLHMEEYTNITKTVTFEKSQEQSVEEVEEVLSEEVVGE